MSNYYNGTKLLSLKDMNGDKPEIYICTTNRSGGKTTYFGRYFVNRFLNKGEQFGLLYRFNYELNDCADKFFKDIGPLFFPGHSMESKTRCQGKFHELLLDGKLCGYAIAINDADSIKKYSHFFSGIERILFDEFQSESNHYCPDEVNKFRSIHVSIARGRGAQCRYLPVYMVSNPVTILNPYYTAMEISSRLTKDAKFIRGEGWVMEQGYVESAAKAQTQSAFNRAFGSDKFSSYVSEGVYLNDCAAFVDKPDGNGRYLATIKYENREYAIREYANLGIIYCDDKPDSSYKYKLCVTTDDHQINYVMLSKSDLFIQNMRYYFSKGAFRFKNLQCKAVIMKTLSY